MGNLGYVVEKYNNDTKLNYFEFEPIKKEQYSAPADPFASSFKNDMPYGKIKLDDMGFSTKT